MSTLNYNMVTAPPVVIEAFDDAGDWAVTDATVTADTARYHYGSQSLNLTSTVAGGSAYIKKTGLSLNLSAQFPLRYWFQIPIESDYLDIPAIDVYLVTSNGNHYWANLFIYPSAGNERHGNGTWQSWLLYPSDFIAVGAPDWANITQLWVKCRSDVGKTPSVLCGLIEHPHLQGAIMFDWDDSRDNIYTNAKDVFHDRGLRCNVFAIPQQVGSAGFMTWAQLVELDALGWDICNHGYASIDQRIATYDQAYADIDNGRVALESHALTRAARHFGYYGGVVGVNTPAAMRAAGMLTGRISGGYPVTLPYANQYLTWAEPIGSGLDPVAAAEPIIDNVALYGGVARFVTHQVGAGLDVEVSELETILDYAIASGLPVITESNLYAASLGETYVTGGDTLGFVSESSTAQIGGASVEATIVSGDTHEREVTIMQADGVTRQNITGWAFSYVIAPGRGRTADVTKNNASGITLDANPATGKLKVLLDPADTAALAGEHYHELQGIDPAGNVSTVLYGRLRVEPDSA